MMMIYCRKALVLFNWVMVLLLVSCNQEAQPKEVEAQKLHFTLYTHHIGVGQWDIRDLDVLSLNDFEHLLKNKDNKQLTIILHVDYQTRSVELVGVVELLNKYNFSYSFKFRPFKKVAQHLLESRYKKPDSEKSICVPFEEEEVGDH